MKAIRSVAFIMFVLLVALPACIGQTNPNLENGLVPFGSYDHSNFDSVNVATGNLTLHIPLFSYPQRGSLPTGFALVLNTKNLFVFQNCNAQTGTCADRWNINPYQGVHVTQINLPGINYKYKNGSYDINAVSWDGGSHQMGLVGGGPLESLDATGIAMNNQVPPTTVTDKHGNINNTSGLLQDTNGNFTQFSVSANTFTDTLGRVFPSSNTGTSDYTGCGGPTGQITGANIQNFPGPNGTTRQVKTCYEIVPIKTNFNAHNQDQVPAITELNLSISMVQSVVVYNGTSWATSPAWTFEYSDRNSGDPSTINYGSLTKVTLPTGGSISYAYGTYGLCGTDTIITPVSRGIISRTEDANDGTGPHTTTYGGGTVTDPQGNATVHTFIYFGCLAFDNTVQYYQGSSSTGTLLKTVQTNYTYNPINPFDSWNDGANTVLDVVPVKVTTTTNGQVTKTETDWDQTFVSVEGAHYSYGNVTEKREYDNNVGSTYPLIRRTDYTYTAFNNSSYLAANMLDRIASVTVYDGNSNKIAQTTYGYDESGAVSSGITTQHGAPPGTYRGNQTSVKKWLNTTGGTLNTTTTFYDTGMPYQRTDPRGNTTTYSYSGTYIGGYLTQTQFPTINSIVDKISATYDFNTGNVASFTDANSNVSNYSYDGLGRFSVATYPDNGQTSASYVDTFPTSDTVTKKISTSPTVINLVKTTNFDGLGRKIQTQLTSDPLGTDSSETTYDTLDRVYTVTNPHRSTSFYTDGSTTTNYDALNRVTSFVEQDGSKVSTSYNANCTTVTDEAANSRKSCTDGAGRLTQVIEDPAGLAYETDYTYDALDNLLTVNQKGGSTVSSNWRTRTFTYDSLSHLLTASNPESGLITYTYDANGNVATKTAPKPNQTGTATVVTTYTYDALNRLTNKSYNDGSLQLGYYYDACSFCTVPITNGIGRLVHSSNNVSTAPIYSYDKMGRVIVKNGCMPLSCTDNAYPVTVAYDLAGDPISYSAAGNTFTETFDGAQRMTKIASSWVDGQHPSPLWSSDATQGYYPHGAVKLATFGNGLTESILIASRIQTCRMDLASSATIQPACDDTVPPQNLLHLHYAYGGWGVSDAGNVTSVVAIGAQNFNRTYGYDSLNRLKTMSAPGDACSGLSWTIDPWGNRTDQTVTGGACNTFHSSVAANNRLMTPYTYDAAGNLTSDGTHTYTYNAENQLIQVDGGSTATYLYDPEGRRVEKISGGTTLAYLYHPNGNVLAEVTSSGLLHGYTYQGSRLVAEYENGTTYFVHGDLLGSTRLVTGVSKNIVDNLDYLPFGEQTGGDTATTHKFTGKERDSESGLDNSGARYGSSAMGRFMTPDWSSAPMGVPYAEFGNPQSLNLYSYVKNNPLSLSDPDGHCCWEWLAPAIQYIHPAESAQVAVGMGKQLLNNGLGTEIQPSNGLQQAGADFLKNSVGPSVALVGPLVGAGEGEGPGALPNDALVVRGGSANPGGANSPEGIAAGTDTHPSGVTGFSAESAAGKSAGQLAQESPATSKYGQVGCCTVGEVRKAGGDVVPTSGQSPNHATVTGLTPQKASQLLTPTIPNPAKTESQQ